MFEPVVIHEGQLDNVTFKTKALINDIDEFNRMKVLHFWWSRAKNVEYQSFVIPCVGPPLITLWGG